MSKKTSVSGRVDYATSVRLGRIVTYDEQKSYLLSVAKRAGEDFKSGAQKAAQPIIATISPGKQLFNAMKELFTYPTVNVKSEQVGKLRFIKAVEYCQETFPVSFSKKMNRVVVWDNSNKKSLTLDQFKAMIVK
jgi:hypothetical protein